MYSSLTLSTLGGKCSREKSNEVAALDTDVEYDASLARMAADHLWQPQSNENTWQPDPMDVGWFLDVGAKGVLIKWWEPR